MLAVLDIRFDFRFLATRRIKVTSYAATLFDFKEWNLDGAYVHGGRTARTEGAT